MKRYDNMRAERRSTMEQTSERAIALLQENLSIIRKVAGWTTEDMGSRIGVTKQTISNIENKKTKLTLTQYIAIRAVLDYEIQSNPDNKALAQVVDILLNKDGEFSDEEEKKISEAVEVISSAAAGGAGTAVLAATTAALLGAIPLVGVAVSTAITGSSIWMPKVLDKIKNKKK